MKLEDLIELYKNLENVSQYPHKCLTAAIVYSNWKPDGVPLYDGNHIIFSVEHKIIDNNGFVDITEPVGNFLKLEYYGREYIKEAFCDVDWEEELYKNFLNKQFN